MPPRNRSRKKGLSRPIGLLICILIAALLGTALFSGIIGDTPGSLFRPGTTGDLRAYYLDVGQGDASVILFKDAVILIDAGDVGRGDDVVRALRRLGVQQIDLLVATHPHADHIGGMQEVLSSYRVARVLDAGMPASSVLYERFLQTIDEKNISYTIAEQGQTIDIDPALGILVLSPPKDRIGDDLNTNSIVLRVSYGTVNLLYTGDATTSAEDLMLKTGYPLDARVLKVGHHGSSGSGSAAFLSRVAPEVAILSLGEDNTYGHPHREALDRLARAGPAVYRTDIHGTILVQSNGESFSVLTEAGGDDIWSSLANAPTTTTTDSPATQPVTTGATPVPFTIPTLPENVTIAVPAITIPPLQLGNASMVSITAVQFDAPGDDRVNLNGEWVRIANTGSDVVLMAGWTLSDKDTRDLYIFPAFLLLPEEEVTVYAGSGTMNGTALFMG
jgi:competence protein ComEC